MADHDAFTVPDNVRDEQALFVSDALATGYMGAEMCNIHHGDIVAVWGCGGVGQMAIRSAWLLGAERVIAIDRIPNRLRMAQEHGKAETLNYDEVDVLDALDHMTGGRGPDACIDAVGMEAEGKGVQYLYDRTKQALRLETDRPLVLREVIEACRKGGTLSVIGVYGGFVDKFPMGPLMNKALTLRTGQQHGQRYARRLLDHISRGELDPSYIITQRMSLDDAVRRLRHVPHAHGGLRPAGVLYQRRTHVIQWELARLARRDGRRPTGPRRGIRRREFRRLSGSMRRRSV